MTCEDTIRKVRERVRLTVKQEDKQAKRRHYENYSNGKCNVIRHGPRENASVFRP